MKKIRKRWTAALPALGLGLLCPNALALEGPTPGSLTQSTLTLPSGPASIKGLADDPSVSVFSGQVSYSVPIELPKSAADFAPAFSLHYDGARGNGPLGLGWGVDFPRIRRSLRQGVPSYDDAGDELEVVGLGVSGRIRPLDDGSYRVEGAGNALKVQRFGNFFLVTDKDGVRYYMGLNGSGRQDSGDGRTAQWLTQYIQHPAGQSVRLTYRTDQGQIYLSGLSWGPDDAFSATLEYEPRPDVVTSHRSGFPVVTADRLHKVTVTAFEEELRAYTLSYDDDFVLSRLAQVTMTGRGGVGAMPPVSFGYEVGRTATSTALTGGEGWTPSMPDVAVVDVDADGMSDLVHLSPSSHTYYRNLGGEFGPPQNLPGAIGTSLSSGTARLMDMNGDGTTELVRTGERWQVYRLDEGGFADAEDWFGTEGLPVVDSDLSFTDVNGDGRTDVVQRAGTGMFLRMNTDGGLMPPEYFDSFDGEPLPGRRSLRFQDATGDGLADAIRVTSEEAEVWPGLGDGRFAPPYVIAFPFSETDLSNIWLADLNRDDVLDVVHVELGDVTFYPANTDGTLNEAVVLDRPVGADSTSRVNLADLNGNGSIDVLWSTTTGMWALDLAGATRAGMLERVDNGMGKFLTFSYEASAQLALEDELAGDPWMDHLPVSIPVAVHTTTDLQSGDPARQVSYAVRDGFYDGEERRFGGFRQGSVTQHGDTPATTLVETSLYHEGLGDARALRGQAFRKEVRDGTGKVFSVTLQEWNAMQLDGFPDDALLRIPRLSSTWKLTYEGAATPVLSRRTHDYDGEGNETSVLDYGRMDLTGDEVFTERTFVSNDTLWVRGRVVSETIQDGTGTVLNQTRTYYDGDEEPLSLGELTFGWSRRTESWYEEGGRWVVATETDYDELGNVVTKREQERVRDIVYDENGLFPVEEILEPNTPAALSWSSSWDRVLAKPLTITAPDGVVQTLTYDTLGRQASHAVNGDVDRVYAYSWTSPTPTTTTWLYDGDINADGVVNTSDTRRTVQVANSAGQDLYTAMWKGGDDWLLMDGTRYDSRGAAVFLAEATEYRGSELPTQLPPGVVGQQTSFDATGRPLSYTLATGSEKHFVHTAFEVEETTAGMSPVTYGMDGQGRVIQATRTVDGVEESSLTQYDPMGRITEIALLSGAVTHRFTHDSLGRLVHAEDPDAGARSYEYDDGGQMLAADNGDGQRIEWVYDSHGRVSEVTGDDMRPIIVHYDLPRTGSARARRTLGRPAWIEEGTDGDRVEFDYDARGRVAALTRRIGGVQVTESASFSPSGLVLSRGFNDGFEYDYRYDRAGRTLAVGDVWRANDYDAAGRVLRETYGNGIGQTYERDALGFATRVRVATQAKNALLDLEINYNGYGAVSSVVDHDERGLNHTASFAYDGAARLTRATLPEGRVEYGYDALQNMIRRDVVGPLNPKNILAGTYEYGGDGAGPRQLTSAGGGTFEYDGAGRMVSDGKTTLQYSAVDRLLRVNHDSGHSVRYDYGYDGERTAAHGVTEERYFSPHLTMRGEKREYFVRVGDRVVARVDRQLVRKKRRTFDIRRFLERRGLLDNRRASQPSLEESRIFYHQTHGDASVLLTNALRVIVDERRYEPFGAALDADLGVDALSAAGKPVDSVTGWSDHGARWYAPQFARWMVPDPVTKDPGEQFAKAPWSLNPYQYARQSPNVFRDPDGRRDLRMKQCKVGDPPAMPTYNDPFPNIRKHGTTQEYKDALAAHQEFANIAWFTDTYFAIENMTTNSGAQVVDGKLQLTTVGGTKKSFTVLYANAVADSIVGEAQGHLIKSIGGEKFAARLGLAMTVLGIAQTLNGVRIENWWGKVSNAEARVHTRRLVINAVGQKGTAPVFKKCYTCGNNGAKRAIWINKQRKEWEGAVGKLYKYKELERKYSGARPPQKSWTKPPPGI